MALVKPAIVAVAMEEVLGGGFQVLGGGGGGGGEGYHQIKLLSIELLNALIYSSSLGGAKKLKFAPFCSS